MRDIIKQVEAEGMYRFLIVIEDAGTNFSAFSPDLPGCVATGKTREETEKAMVEAIRLHVEGLLEDGQPIPACSSFAEYVVLDSLAKDSAA